MEQTLPPVVRRLWPYGKSSAVRDPAQSHGHCVNFTAECAVSMGQTLPGLAAPFDDVPQRQS